VPTGTLRYGLRVIADVIAAEPGPPAPALDVVEAGLSAIPG
jgi:hypothetical protein